LIDRPEGGGFRIRCTEHSGSLCHDASVGHQGSRPCSLRQTCLIYWEKYQYGEMQWLIQLPIPVRFGLSGREQRRKAHRSRRGRAIKEFSLKRNPLSLTHEEKSTVVQ
jgi:hypothetical protein